tara:strand:+ start:490 stop:1236 length:747 start_codon:yes stop_codon:yes gene_type:complete
MLQAVFWDVDGTIAETEMQGHRKAFNKAFNYFNLDWYWSVRTYTSLLEVTGGRNRIKYFAQNNSLNLNSELINDIHFKKQEFYKSIINKGEIPLREGVFRLINELKDKSVMQVIVTTSSRLAVIPLLEKHFKCIYDIFDAIYTFEDVINTKPHPEIYIKAKNDINLSSKDILVIEDSLQGYKSANEAGLNVLITLPIWNCAISPEMTDCLSIVDNLGSESKKSTFYSQNESINGFVDYTYLNKLLIDN